MENQNEYSANKYQIVKVKVIKMSGTLDQYRVKLTRQNGKNPIEKWFSVEDIANFDNNNTEKQEKCKNENKN